VRANGQSVLQIDPATREVTKQFASEVRGFDGTLDHGLVKGAVHVDGRLTIACFPRGAYP
jgi:hypothetical protein